MSWENAPTLNKLTAAQQGGRDIKRGAQIWGVDYKGTLYTNYQKTPGGEWAGWRGPDWAGPGYPKQVYELAASNMALDGPVMLWVLDMKRQLWFIEQTLPGGDWGKWQGPNWNNAPQGLKKLTASRTANRLAAQVWALKDDGTLISCIQKAPAPGVKWKPWADWPATRENSKFIEITACNQADERTALWAIDNKRQLWGMGMKGPGDWDGASWSGPNWEGIKKKVSNVAAVEQGGARGARVWVIDDDQRLSCNYQITPGGRWTGWSDGWERAPDSYELTAAGMNDGRLEIWTITSLKGVLTSLVQISPDGDWGTWSERTDREGRGEEHHP